MSGNVRRLTLDINPLIQLYLLFLVGGGLLLDYDWCSYYSDHQIPSLMPGVLFGIAASISLPKTVVWRLLPVSRIEMDRARWWLGIGGPAVALGLIMAMALAWARAMGHPMPGPGSIALLVAAQIGVSAILILIQWILLPLSARATGRWNKFLLFPYLLLIFRLLLLPRDREAVQQFTWGLAGAGLATAALLYSCAGRWPAPMINWLWAASAPQTVPAAPQAPGARGWPALAVNLLPILLLTWMGVILVPAGIRLMVPNIDLSFISLIVVLLAAQICVTQLASAMRILRALPLTGIRLTLYLVAILTAVAAVSLLVFHLGEVATGEQWNPASLIPLLCLPLLYFPSTLRFGFRFAQFGYATSLIVMLPLQFLDSVAPFSVILLATGALGVAGIVWTWWEITRGHSAYRLQPMVAPRWRGSD
jgi:hypothetical protein